VGPRRRNRHRGVWQRRFWEHTVRDDWDFERQLEYIHYNPVKHGYASCAKDWPWSSFHRCVLNGDYPLDWGCGRMSFADIGSLVGE
jgi:putative transposase